ncbi:MAG: hypothetical protein PHG40_01070 [Candidatus Omnitrophica bacterium]|nr:hypothetical protein [Candidatus Omnitrophota bacterium]
MKKIKVFLIFIALSAIPLLSCLAGEPGAAAEALFDSGRKFFREQRYSDAQLEFKKCLLADPGYQKAKFYLGLCEERMNFRRNEAMRLAMDNIKDKTQASSETQTTDVTDQENSIAPSVGKGAWTLKKGEMYAELYSKYYWHNRHFNDERHSERWDYQGKGNEIRQELKLEYGYDDRLTMLLYTVYKQAHWKDSFNKGNVKGFEEIWPGVKYNIFQKPFILTMQGKMKFPFDYDEHTTPALGTHQIDGELKILTAQPWNKIKSYTKVEFGYRWRAEEPSNEIPYYFEFGYNPKRWLVLKTSLDCNESLANTGGTNEDWMKYTIGPIFKFKGLGSIELGFGHTFFGKNTSAAKEFFSSISTQW